MNYEEIQKLEKAKKKLKEDYQKEIDEIKNEYHVNFNIDYSNDNEIKVINFFNVKYKEDFINVSLEYDNNTNDFDSLKYEFHNFNFLDNNNWQKDLDTIVEKCKLKSIITTIKKKNINYLEKLKNMDKQLSIFEKSNIA